MSRRAAIVVRTWEWLGLLACVAVAALLRIPGLADRGTWDSDQGHDMLVLRAFVRDGVVPLLGPPTSIGDVHHGALYYYLLAPAAWLTGGDSPLAVVAVIALSGIAAVAVAWWLARSIAGPWAGLVAALVLATSAAAIDESTFIWNPNLIALSSSVALAAAWRASSSGRPRWWLVAAAATAVTMHCHVLGVALLPVIGALFVLHARRGHAAPADVPNGAPASWRIAAAALGIIALSYVPLVVNELSTGFSEVRAAMAYVADDSGSSDADLATRFLIAGLRVVAWPLAGLITDGFVPGAVATVGVIAIVAWRWRSPEGIAVRWLGLGLLWSTAFLAVAAPSLATIVPGLPNDHYHAFADPMVVVLVGIGAAALLRSVPAPVGPGLVAIGLVALLGWNLTHLPPGPHPDGGFPAAAAAAERVDAALTADGIARDAVVPIRSLPDFKSTESMAYPLVRLGRSVAAMTPDGLSPGSTASPGAKSGLVLLCDDLFRVAIGAACGGPAEDAAIEQTPLDRFEVAPGRWVSVYGP